MRRTPLRYRARATRGDQLLAATDAPVRVDAPDAAPLLWFPRADVEPEVLAGDGPWQAGVGDLADHVAFDHEQVLLDLTDPADGEAPKDVIRFPNWGDADDLVAIIDVQRDGDRWVNRARSDWRRPVVEGSQILGQAVVAASRHAPGRRAVLASMAFPRAADARVPYHLVLDQVTGGRTFTALRAEARQGDRTCAFGSLLLDVTAPDVMRHADPVPDVPGPDESAPYDMGVTGRDLRIVDDAYTGDPDAPVGPPELAAWVRFRRVPDDQPVHAGLLAQFTGHLSIAAAMRPHAGIGQDQAHRRLSTAVNAITLSLHGDVRADRWMLYHHRSTYAGDGMTHAECRVYDQDRALVASFTVEAMVRGFADPTAEVDHRSAL